MTHFDKYDGGLDRVTHILGSVLAKGIGLEKWLAGQYQKKLRNIIETELSSELSDEHILSAVYDQIYTLDGYDLAQAEKIAGGTSGTLLHAAFTKLVDSRGCYSLIDATESFTELEAQKFYCFKDWYLHKFMNFYEVLSCGNDILLDTDLGVGGTPDLIARRFDGQLSLWDFKTNKSPAPWDWYNQDNFYAWLFDRKYQRPIDALHILYVHQTRSKHPNVQYTIYPTHGVWTPDQKIAEAVLTLYRGCGKLLCKDKDNERETRK